MANMTTKLDGREVVSYDTKETAAFIRKALKAAFPSVKFSVRISLYSMGSSTYVSWTDGPTDDMVSAVVSAFKSTSFDGSDDSTHHNTQMVDGVEVQYQGYINTRREVSSTLREKAERLAGLLGIDNVYEVLHTMRGDGVRVTLKRA